MANPFEKTFPFIKFTILTKLKIYKIHYDMIDGQHYWGWVSNYEMHNEINLFYKFIITDHYK